MSGTNPEDFCEPSNLTIMENWHCHSYTREKRVMTPESETRVKTPNNQFDDSRNYYCSPQKPGKN